MIGHGETLARGVVGRGWARCCVVVDGVLGGAPRSLTRPGWHSSVLCSKCAANVWTEMYIFGLVASFGECNGWAGFNPKEYFSWCRPVEHYPRRIVD